MMIHKIGRQVLPKTPRKTSAPKPKESKDPVEVYCRVRPLSEGQESVVDVQNETTIQLNPPKITGSTRGSNKEIVCNFKKIFTASDTQKTVFDTVALPILEDLIGGKNGLIFTYGITGSGKTHTVSGSLSDGGLLPRSLDVIFNSISYLQPKRSVFKLDKNGAVDLKTAAEDTADTESRAVLFCSREDLDTAEAGRTPDPSRICNVDEDNCYSVFVSYMEIYNNYIYDLLDDVQSDNLGNAKPPVSKLLREDASKNMFVSGLVEIEIRSPEEGFTVFNKGQKRRRVAHTQLNTESSRSHSVFTIKVVQAPLDLQGEDILQDRSKIAVSQLSLCDLAGSERISRTQNEGERLREAGNINNSLLTLRTCIEILRENQRLADMGGGAQKIVPYRDSKVTHLFKNFFEGEGKVRMIVCLNPRLDDYEESLHVVKFAEITQEVKVTRGEAVRFETGMTPGRRKANQLWKEAVAKAKDDQPDFDDDIEMPLPSTPPFPDLEGLASTDGSASTILINYLIERDAFRSTVFAEFQQRSKAVRAVLVECEEENESLQKKLSELAMMLADKDRLFLDMERRCKHAQQKAEEYRRLLECEQQEKVKLRQEFNEVLSAEKWKSEDIAKRMREKELDLEGRMLLRSEKLRQLKEIIQENYDPNLHMADHAADAEVVTPVPHERNQAKSSRLGTKPVVYMTRATRAGLTPSGGFERPLPVPARKPIVETPQHKAKQRRSRSCDPPTKTLKKNSNGPPCKASVERLDGTSCDLDSSSLSRKRSCNSTDEDSWGEQTTKIDSLGDTPVASKRRK